MINELLEVVMALQDQRNDGEEYHQASAIVRQVNPADYQPELNFAMSEQNLVDSAKKTPVAEKKQTHEQEYSKWSLGGELVWLINPKLEEPNQLITDVNNQFGTNIDNWDDEFIGAVGIRANYDISDRLSLTMQGSYSAGPTGGTERVIDPTFGPLDVTAKEKYPSVIRLEMGPRYKLVDGRKVDFSIAGGLDYSFIKAEGEFGVNVLAAPEFSQSQSAKTSGNGLGYWATTITSFKLSPRNRFEIEAGYNHDIVDTNGGGTNLEVDLSSPRMVFRVMSRLGKKH